MPMQLAPLPVRDLSGGMISNIADILLPPSVAKQTINLHGDSLGKLTQRYGTTLLGAQVNGANPCRGLQSFISADGNTTEVLAVFNRVVYGYNGTTWSNLTSVNDSTKVRFANFLNGTFCVGGGSATAFQSGGAGAFSTTTHLSGAPTGNLISVFQNKLFIASTTTPDRVFFSSVVSTAGEITWDSTDWFDLDPEDGDVLTGLWSTSSLLLAFKNRSFYTWNGSSVGEIVGIGTSSQESIAECKGFVFFFNPDGIFVTQGAYPQEISRPVYDWIDNMDPSFYPNVAGFCDDDHYFVNIGDVTKNGRLYSNVWMVYTISSQVWAVFSMGNSFRNMTKYIVQSTGVVSYIGGDSIGNVQTLFSGTTDNGSPIVWEYESKETEWDGRATTKVATELATYMANGVGAQVMVAEDHNPYKTVGSVKDYVTVLKGLNLRGNFLKMKLTGSNRSTPITIDGYEWLSVQSLGVISK